MDRIPGRDVPGRVVVDAPAEHGKADQQRTGEVEAPLTGVPGQEDTGHGHRGQCPPETFPRILLKEEDGDQGRGYPFEIEQQRGGESLRAAQAVHEADGGDDPAEEGRGGEPGEVLFPQTASPRLRSGRPDLSSQCIERQAEKGPCIEEPRQDQGRNVRHKDLGDGRADTEAGRRGEDIQKGLPIHFVLHPLLRSR